MRADGTIVKWMQEYKHVLVILDVLDTGSMQTLIPTIATLPNTTVTVRNIGA